MSTGVANGADLMVQYHDEAAEQTVVAVGLPTVGSSVDRGWATLPGNAHRRRNFRIAGQDGNATADPVFRAITSFFR